VARKRNKTKVYLSKVRAIDTVILMRYYYDIIIGFYLFNCISHFNWDIFGVVSYETGCSSYILDKVWLQYCGPNTPINKPIQLYRMYKYIHLYPTRHQVPTVLGCSKDTVQNIAAQMTYLAAIMKEIDWEDRLSGKFPSFSIQTLVSRI
jgi:hypothetical protein